MTIIEAIVLGLVQGLTEFIPVSYTAHLLIVPSILGWGDPGAAVSAVIQFGTLLAAIIYFFRDIVRLIGGFFRGLITRRPLAAARTALTMSPLYCSRERERRVSMVAYSSSLPVAVVWRINAAISPGIGGIVSRSRRPGADQTKLICSDGSASG